MGVYIPNMEKPKRCEECRFRTCFIKVNLKKYTCWLNGEECGKTDCPLIEIDLVRCGECKWYEPRHIEENGIECAGQCIWHIGLKTYCDAHDRENPEDRPRMIIFREPTDFCSYGERRADASNH